MPAIQGRRDIIGAAQTVRSRFFGIFWMLSCSASSRMGMRSRRRAVLPRTLCRHSLCRHAPVSAAHAVLNVRHSPRSNPNSAE